MRRELLFVLLVTGCGPQPPQDEPGLAVVTQVVDGDTIDVTIGGRDERVRLIGIDTPEIAHSACGSRPANPAECFGDAAHEFTEQRLPPGTEVRLVRDTVPRDDYGRLLAYVYLATDGTFVNLELVALGFAQPLTIEPNSAHAPELVAAAKIAEASGVGLWSGCG